MVDSWRNLHQEALSPFRRVPVNYDKELGAKRKRMMELYEDPDWLLQTGLADVEFEQQLYDHMAYGDKGPNELGIDSLRHWNEYGGPLRYMDPSPGETPFAEYSQPWFMYDQSDLSNLGFTNAIDVMDMNLNQIIDTINRGLPRVPHDINWEDTDYSTQNAINDLFTHELIHTNPRLDEFSDIKVTTPFNPPWNPDEIEHPIIYRNTARYGANPAMVAVGQRYWDQSNILKEKSGPHPRPLEWVSNYPNEWINRSKSDIANDIVRESTAYHGRSPIDERRRYPQKVKNGITRDFTQTDYGKAYNTGGIASLML